MVKKKRQTSTCEEKLPTDNGEPNSCLHIKKSVNSTQLHKALKSSGVAVECGQCATKKSTGEAIVSEALASSTGFEYDDTLWICLKCGTQLCGRSKNQHALLHFKTPHSDSHALAMNTRSFEIWCFECNNEVKVHSRQNLEECVDIVKRTTQKPLPQPQKLPAVDNIENKLLATFEAIRPYVNKTDETLSVGKALPFPPVPPPPPIPGMAKRINEPVLGTSGILGANARTSFTLGSYPAMANNAVLNNSKETLSFEQLPRVRGLTNLGNTCFFNAVLQCLAQTPYLLDVLKEASEPGEEFTLPGGSFKFKDGEDFELPMIKGTLSSWGSLTAALAQALEELQSGGGVFRPGILFDKLCTKCPQFRGGDQHDSHELLRQLLESVRSEDLKRYQRVILQNLGYKNNENASEEMRQKCKIYGNQAADRILRPDQVFRGFLVSTLTCQTCYHVSSRHEYFLDLSLPVMVEKPQPPQRRKPSPENTPSTSSFFLDGPSFGTDTNLSKAQQRKEKKSERKAQRDSAMRETVKLALARRKLQNGEPCDVDASASGSANCDEALAMLSSSSSYEQSDADVEDNLIDDNDTENRARIGKLPTAPIYNTNGNNSGKLTSPASREKRGDSPENMDKDSLDEDENDSGIATSPAYTGSNHNLPSSETNGGGAISSDANSAPINNSVMSIGLSEKGANLMRSLSLGGDAEPNAAAVPQQNGQAATQLTEAAADETVELAQRLANDLQLQQKQQKAARARKKRTRKQSSSDWSTTIAPRFHCEDGECSVQSCLNSFTGIELMTGSNKVGCENCTNNMHANNNEDSEAASKKSVYTNATKQFLVSSPPAVLILHLKRFQLGARCIFRKLARPVSYPMVLDIAPFCGSKVKNLANIDRKQKKLLYALYGVVEHSGSMYGGHYTAYVKVRAQLTSADKRWKFIPQGSKAELDQDDEQRKKLEELLAREQAKDLRLKAANDSDDFTTSGSASGNTSNTESSEECEEDDKGKKRETEEASNVKVPPGKWYYVSDSHVQEVTEESALQAQAYLLFYERIY